MKAPKAVGTAVLLVSFWGGAAAVAATLHLPNIFPSLEKPWLPLGIIAILTCAGAAAGLWLAAGKRVRWYVLVLPLPTAVGAVIGGTLFALAVGVLLAFTGVRGYYLL